MIRGMTGVIEVSRMIRERRPQRFRYVMRSEEENVSKRVQNAGEGSKRRIAPKSR